MLLKRYCGRETLGFLFFLVPLVLGFEGKKMFLRSERKDPLATYVPCRLQAVVHGNKWTNHECCTPDIRRVIYREETEPLGTWQGECAR